MSAALEDPQPAELSRSGASTVDSSAHAALLPGPWVTHVKIDRDLEHWRCPLSLFQPPAVSNPGRSHPPTGQTPPSDGPGRSAAALPTSDMPHLDCQPPAHAIAANALPDMRTPLTSSGHTMGRTPPSPFTLACRPQTPPMPSTQACHAYPADNLPVATAARVSPGSGACDNAPTDAHALPDALARRVVSASPALHAEISPPSSLLTASLGRRQGQAHERRPRLPSRTCKRRRLSRTSSYAAPSPMTQPPMFLRPAATCTALATPVATAALSAPDARAADAIAPSLAPDVPAPRLSFDPGG